MYAKTPEQLYQERQMPLSWWYLASRGCAWVLDQGPYMRKNARELENEENQ
jgi:hypothetical protein